MAEWLTEAEVEELRNLDFGTNPLLDRLIAERERLRLLLAAERETGAGGVSVGGLVTDIENREITALRRTAEELAGALRLLVRERDCYCARVVQEPCGHCLAIAALARAAQSGVKI